MILTLTIILATVYLLINIGLIALKNHRAHKFFKKNSPNIPTLPSPSLLAGHLFSLTHKDKSVWMLADLHKKYGPTFGYFSVDQPWVATKDLDLIKKIMLDEAHKHLNHMDYGVPFPEFSNSIFSLNGEFWRRARKAVAPTLTNHKVQADGVSKIVEAAIEELRKALELRLDEAKEQTGSREIVLQADDIFIRLSLSVIFRIVYQQDNMIDFKADRDLWAGRVTTASENFKTPMMPLAKVFRFIQPLVLFLAKFTIVGRTNTELTACIDKTVQTVKKRRLAMKLKGQENNEQQVLTNERSHFEPRLLDLAIEAYLDKKVSYDHFISTIHFLLIAGFQTTGDSICHLIWRLAKHPEIQEKLRESIIESGVDSEYLTWVINEGLRMHHPSPMVIGRVVGEDVIGTNGVVVPKGSYVMPSTFAINYDPENWVDPYCFNPERWSNKKDLHPALNLSFGMGPRNCVGQKLALHEIKLMLQMLLTRYRFTKCPETPEEYNFSSKGQIFVIPDQPIKVRLVPL